MTPADPGTPDWLREVAAFAHWPVADGRGPDAFKPARAVLLSDALAALEAREQATIERAAKWLRDKAVEEDRPDAFLDAVAYRMSADFLERELRPEGQR